MKTFSLTALLVVCLSGTALALTPMGPPTTVLKQGQFEVGGVFGWSENEIDFSSPLGEVDDLEFNTVLFRPAVGIASDRVEVFGLVGCSEFEDADATALGFGLRITTNLEDQLSWGLVGQIVWFEDDERMWIDGFYGDTDLDFYEAQIGFGACWRYDIFVLYGGPFLRFIDGELTNTLDMEQSKWIGGFVGGGFDLGPASAIVEVQATQGDVGVGVNVALRF